MMMMMRTVIKIRKAVIIIDGNADAMANEDLMMMTMMTMIKAMMVVMMRVIVRHRRTCDVMLSCCSNF